ncbi:MAG: SIMPL domain-containing protein [Parvularculaceae bacterium]
MRALTLIFPVITIFAAAPAFADDDTFAIRTISVTGEGEASATPDMMILNIGVETEGATAAEALKKNAAQMNATINAIRDGGVAKKDIQTSNLSVNARYNYPRDGSTPQLTGYQASNSVRVKIHEIDKAGRMIDRTVESGANRLNSISFAFSDEKPLLEKARKNAVADARSKAELYADASGVKLGKVLQISEGGIYAPRPVPVSARLKAADAAATPITTGESTVSVNLNIIYAIE